VEPVLGAQQGAGAGVHDVEPDTNAAETHDRYKASSLKAYNLKLPDRYDTAIALRVLRVSVMDEFVVDEIGSEIGSLSVLDVGCATGRLLERLAAAGARSLAGSDLAPRIVEVAKARLEGLGVEADLRPADAESDLPWPTGSFDVVTMTGVLHHFMRPAAALSEMERILRPGGRLVASDACFFPPVREFFNLCLMLHPHEGDYHFYTPSQAAELLSASGWRVVRCRRLNWWAYGVVSLRAGA
jgi:SAM-dependent methyltransferase